MSAPLRRAITLATIAHEGQVDKVGKPYIFHPLTVMMDESLTTDDERIVAALHDVFEDTCMKVSTVMKYLDLPSSRATGVRKALLAITHLRNEPNVLYWARVKATPIATKVKIADIHHNSSPARMRGLPVKDQARMRAKYAAALKALGDGQ